MNFVTADHLDFKHLRNEVFRVSKNIWFKEEYGSSESVTLLTIQELGIICKNQKEEETCYYVLLRMVEQSRRSYYEEVKEIKNNQGQFVLGSVFLQVEKKKPQSKKPVKAFKAKPKFEPDLLLDFGELEENTKKDLSLLINIL